MGKECDHDIKAKVENGQIITYCAKCGKVMDAKPASNGISRSGKWQEGLISDNGGEILHD